MRKKMKTRTHEQNVEKGAKACDRVTVHEEENVQRAHEDDDQEAKGYGGTVRPSVVTARLTCNTKPWTRILRECKTMLAKKVAKATLAEAEKRQPAGEGAGKGQPQITKRPDSN